MLNQNSHVGECGDTVPIYLVSTSSLKLQYGEIGKGCGAGCAASCDPARQPSAASVLWDRRLFGLPGSAGGGLPSGRAYCLMPNHVHLILVPLDTEGLRAALAETHRRYTTRVILREGWRGYLWQGGSHRSRWMRLMCWSARDTSSSIRYARVSRDGHAIGAGRALV